MERRFPASMALAMSAAVLFPALAAGQTPPMGGGYTNVIPIPVDDPKTKAIGGALFKPAGAGPFPAVIYMSWCFGIDDPAARALQKSLIDHLQSKGVATLIVDPYTPRGETERCKDADIARGGDDAIAALKVLKAMPDIDGEHIFLQGYSLGAMSSLSSIDRTFRESDIAKVAGVIAYYPYCYSGIDVEPSVPVLILIGEKDENTPAAACEALKGAPNVEVVVYPGATHAFNTLGVGDLMEGHHIAYDEKSTRDAEQRADAFIAAHMR